MKDLVASLIRAAVAQPGACVFDSFARNVDAHSAAPAHSLAELRALRSTKTKGDIFETFCCLYLRAKRGYREAWRVPDAPRELAVSLGVGGRDMGIDLIGVDPQGRPAAVQCKYRTMSARSTFVPGTHIRRDVVPWRDLATFYALCARTGPWSRHVVMTNAVGVRSLRGVPKGEKDTSICRASLRALTTLDMVAMLALLGQTSSPPPPADENKENIAISRSVDELRAARALFYQKQKPLTLAA